MVGMAAVEPVGHTIDLVLADDVGIVDVGVVDRDAEVEYGIDARPVAESNGHAVGILRVEVLDVFIIFRDVRTELLLVGLIHIGHGVEGGLHRMGHIAVEGLPDLMLEAVEIVLLLGGGVEVKVGGHITLLGTSEPTDIIVHLTVGRLLLGQQFRSLPRQTLRLQERPHGEVVVIAFQRPAGGGEHRGGTEVESWIAGGEGPHVVGRTAALAVGRHLVRLQRRVVVQAIGDRGCIAQVVIVVEGGVGERRGHVPDLLSLRHEVERAVLDELQDVGHAVGTMEVDIALLLRDEGLVALGMEEFPGADEVLHDVDVRACLDVEVTGIEESADVQAGNEFQRLVFGVGGRTLTVQVEVVGRRRLQIALLEWLAVPRAIALVHIHVIHVDGHPDVGSGIGDLVIDVRVDEEVVGLRFAILDIVDTRLLDAAEVELHIIIFIVGSPLPDVALEGLHGRAVGIDAHQRGGGLRRVVLVEFDDGHLRLLRGVADLRETDVRLTDPALDGIGLDGPRDNLAGLTGRQHAADDEPAVLCEHTAVVEFQLRVAGDGDEARGIVGGHTQRVTGIDGQRVDEAVGTTVVVGLEALELTRLLTVRTGDGLAGGIARQTTQATVHRVCLQPVLRRQELDVEASLASQFLRHGLVEPDGNLHGLTLDGHDDAAVEVLGEASVSAAQRIFLIAHGDLDGAVHAVHLAVGHLRHEVPLFGCVVQTDSSALDGPHAVVDDLDTGVLLVVEPAVKTIAEHQHVHPLPLEILAVV